MNEWRQDRTAVLPTRARKKKESEDDGKRRHRWTAGIQNRTWRGKACGRMEERHKDEWKKRFMFFILQKECSYVSTIIKYSGDSVVLKGGGKE